MKKILCAILLVCCMTARGTEWLWTGKGWQAGMRQPTNNAVAGKTNAIVQTGDDWKWVEQSQVSSGGATNLTPWTSDIDGAGKDLTNAANGTFTNSITVGSAANTNVTLKLAGGGTFTVSNGVSAKTWKFLPTGEALGTFQSPTNPLPAANIVAMGEYDYTTNAAFPISGFSGVNGTSYNYGILHVKNSGSTFAITPPTGCRSTNGTWYCTNDTTITAKIIPGRATNVICYPEW